MMEKWLVGVDLGGTTTKLAFLNQNGDILQKWEIETDVSEKGKNITTNIATAISEKLKEMGEIEERLLGIGMGAPGPVDGETGVIYEAINLGWTNYPLRDLLAEATGLPVVVDNDANMAALGEMWKGAGNGARDLVCVTLGTGVGGGVIANGAIVQGVSGAAGEFGHVIVELEGGATCNCGLNGCLETVASATGIVRLAMRELDANGDSHLAYILRQNGHITAKDVADCAKQGDNYAQSVFDRVSFYLGYVLANVANTLNPEKIVIGGGVSKAGDILLNNVRKYFQQFTFSQVRKSTSLAIANLGNDAGVIGAAWLIKVKMQEK